MIGTYDLRYQPWAVGDLLLFHTACNCLSSKYELRFVHDPNIRPPHFYHVPSDPAFYLQQLIQISEGFKKCTSVEVGFHSGWPQKNDYLYYYIMDEILLPFYEKNGHLPKLETKKIEWAKKFHQDNGTKGIIHVRRHPHNPNPRDSVVPEWEKFISRLPEKVVLIGDVEIDGAISARNLKSDEQMALIDASQWYMGASSGPSTLALVNDIPSRIFAREVPPIDVKSQKRGDIKFGPRYKVFEGAESADFLMYQYETLQ